MEQPDIIIIDDDPMVGELSRDLLTEEGYKVLLVQDSLEAVATIRANMPRLIVTDIMMPGITGMDICKTVKTDPGLKHIKIIVVSGKSYQVEQQRAYQFGADFFLQKPYNVATFSQTVKTVLEGVPAGAAQQPPAPVAAAQAVQPEQFPELPEGQIKVTIWGGRGMPLTLPNSASRYGRQTGCVSFETHSNLFIFDAGTGIVPLGEEVAAKKRYYKDIWIILTHFHPANILGLGNFKPAMDPNFAIHIIGANDPEKSLKEVTQHAFYSSFASAGGPPKAKIDIYEILEDNYELIPGVRLSSMYANHPTNTMIYSIEHLGKKIVYAPDSEIWGDATAFQDYDERLELFSKNANLFIHDCAFNDADYASHKHEGHSPLSTVVEFCGEKNLAKELALANLNPDYTDEMLDQMLSDAQAMIKAKSYALNCSLASEGKSYIIEGK